MRTSIALIPALTVAAALRPSPVLPETRRAAPPVMHDAEPEASAAPLPNPLNAAFAALFSTSPEVDRAPSPPPHAAAVWAHVAELLDRVYLMFHRERYGLAISYCDEILRIDPQYPVALELKTLAQRLRHMTVGDRRVLDDLLEDRMLHTDASMLRPAIPRPETFRVPSRDAWAEMGRRTWTMGASEDPGRVQGVRVAQFRLDSAQITLDFDNTKMEDVLAFIRDQAGLDILLDAAVRDRVDSDRLVTIHGQDIPVAYLLQRLLDDCSPGLAPIVTEEAVVLLTERVLPTSVFHIETNVSVPGGPILNGEPLDVEAVLRSTRVDVDVQNVPMGYVVQVLRGQTGLDLRLDGEIEGTVTFKVSDIYLDGTLKLLLRHRGLDYRIDGSTVWIGPR